MPMLEVRDAVMLNSSQSPTPGKQGCRFCLLKLALVHLWLRNTLPVYCLQQSSSYILTSPLSRLLECENLAVRPLAFPHAGKRKSSLQASQDNDNLKGAAAVANNSGKHLLNMAFSLQGDREVEQGLQAFAIAFGADLELLQLAIHK